MNIGRHIPSLLIACLVFTQNAIAQDYILNGVVFQQQTPTGIPAEVAKRMPKGFRVSLIWALEVEQPVTTYEELKLSQQPARLSLTVFPNGMTEGLFTMFGNRISAVYIDDNAYLNKHAGSFIDVKSALPPFITEAQRFALERADNGYVDVWLDDKKLTTIEQEGHFDFWARAWFMGDVMPASYEGSMLQAGNVPQHLHDAFTNRTLPDGYTLFAEEGTEATKQDQPNAYQQNQLPLN